MRDLISNARPYSEQLHAALEIVSEQEIISTEDGVVFSGRKEYRRDFPDRTGYECFANHIHIKDYIEHESPEYMVGQALALAVHLNERLSAVAPDSAFRFIIAADEAGCTLRFHTARIGEEWVASDLEKYAEEAIAVAESNELKKK
jgi:hypothetical protein